MAVKIGFVGAGVIAGNHAKALAKMAGAQVVAVCDVVPGKAAEFIKQQNLESARAFTSHKDMLKQSVLDAVYILLPPYSHGPERDVIRAGCHMFVEKPIHLDLAQAEKIRDAAEARGVVTCAGYMTRYRRSVQRVKELLAEVEQPTLCTGGWIGSPYMVPWWIKKEMSGGQHLEQTTHTFDLARYLFGEVRTLYAASSKGAVKAEGYTIEDASSVVLLFKNGAIGNIMSCCALSTAGGGVSLSVYTSRFVAHFTGWEMGVEIHVGRRDAPLTEKITGESNIFELEDAAFLRAVETKDQTKVLSSYADGVETLRLSVLASQSMETRRPVRMR
jgi:predicted dehydrogenase